MDESSEVADALRCRILSLDGAGAKGFYTSGVLNQLEALLGGQPLCTKFNLIFGSSTGAIIASLLALGKSVAEIRALYEEHVPKVMGRKLASTRSKALERLAADVFKDARFTDGYHAYPETFGTLLVALWT